MGEMSFAFPNDLHPAWSIMIVLYPYITGLVAGAFVVSALYHVFHREALKPVANLALVTSLAFCAFATLPLLLHLHHPERCFLVVIIPSFTSAIAGFGFIYSTYMLVLITEVWLVFRPVLVARAQATSGWQGLLYRIACLGIVDMTPGARAIDERLMRGLALVGIPIACILHGYVGFLFGAVKANPWWSASLMPIIFLASAIVSGISALILLYLFACWRRGVAADQECLRALGRYLWLFLIVAFALETLELGQMAYEADADWHIISQLLQKKLYFSYGIVQVAVGSLVPLLLLPTTLGQRVPSWWRSVALTLSAMLILLQVFAMRWNVVVGGQLFSKSHRGFVDYHLEWFGREGIVVAVIVLLLPLVALTVLSRILPLWSDPDDVTAHGAA